ncbi:hypothetical protein BCV69DRAFT_280105 [Microstroma glucosiphilum]|uniref:Uncharacterized protein n=1 Tax=Pseudomicrostroma glucosiphilum TaxID=1684307 RepID=A0A316UG27_9BASI|nr:hypothetical protein BCV69DRAFT_280105 [Pseudomicrostroma glucosiphilum]PWN24212.1 hypothetical protein BCV69DRAFT_280105 [Pseudomicrostroma glucosiphilum]
MSQQPQALSEGEQAALVEQTQPTETEVAELQTGTTAISRAQPGMEPSPSQLDSRFDRDDLRQGKPPPAVRQGGILSSVAGGPHHLGKGLRKMRKIKVRRPRLGGNKKREELTEEDMTDEEIEVGEEEEAEEGGVEEMPAKTKPTAEGRDGKEKKGVLGKILHQH